MHFLNSVLNARTQPATGKYICVVAPCYTIYSRQYYSCQCQSSLQCKRFSVGIFFAVQDDGSGLAYFLFPFDVINIRAHKNHTLTISKSVCDCGVILLPNLDFTNKFQDAYLCQIFLWHLANRFLVWMLCCFCGYSCVCFNLKLIFEHFAWMVCAMPMTCTTNFVYHGWLVMVTTFHQIVILFFFHRNDYL